MPLAMVGKFIKNLVLEIKLSLQTFDNAQYIFLGHLSKAFCICNFRIYILSQAIHLVNPMVKGLEHALPLKESKIIEFF